MKRFLLIIMLVLVSDIVAAPSVSAQEGCGYGYGGCWDGGYGWLYNTLRYEVPHFAAFPPVYYSVPVPRTYGYSPFAYPPYVRTPDVTISAEPLTIDNPFVPSTKPASTSADTANDRAASATNHIEPLVVINPFVAQGRTVALNGQ